MNSFTRNTDVYQKDTNRTGYCVENEDEDGKVLVFFWHQQEDVKKNERVLTSTLKKQVTADWWEKSCK